MPDLATREHLRHFGPLLARAKSEVGFDQVSQIAVTSGPTVPMPPWIFEIAMLPLRSAKAHPSFLLRNRATKTSLG